MTQPDGIRKLNKNESYKCPLPHNRPRYDLAYFKDFESHFRTFGNRDNDHFEVVKLHEELLWKLRCAESEKRNLSQNDLQELSLRAWLEAVQKSTGKEAKVVQRK